MNLFELKNQFPAAPEYLAQILLIKRDRGVVVNAKLAERLDVSRPAVTQAVGRLKKLGMVKHNRYGNIELTRMGLNIAQGIIRRHFLLEHLLVNVLQYPWDKSDTEAGSLQNYLSDEFTDYLDQYLNRPQICPHGNPMPGSPIEEQYLKAPKLSDAPEGVKVRIIRITEEGELMPGLLPFCQENHLSPGNEFTITGQNVRRTKCKGESGDVDVIHAFAQLILWKPI